jgi:hypothetical protein
MTDSYLLWHMCYCHAIYKIHALREIIQHDDHEKQGQAQGPQDNEKHVARFDMSYNTTYIMNGKNSSKDLP